MIQATAWNSLERTASDWQKLFFSVSPEYQFLGTRTPEGSAVSLIEARFHKRCVEGAAEGNHILRQVPDDTAVLAS